MTAKKPRRVPDVEYERGEEVVALRSGRGRRVRGGGQTSFSEGDVLTVTSVLSGWLNVRRGTYGYVFRVQSSWVRPVGRPVRFFGEAPEGAIAADDPRLDWLWRDAARLADRSGHCAEYDALCDQLGIPGRVRTFSVVVDVAPGVTLRGRVDARSYGEAERMLARQVVEQVHAARGPLAIEGGAR